MFIIAAIGAILTLYHIADFTRWGLSDGLTWLNTGYKKGPHNSIRWKDVPQRHPVASMIQLPTDVPAAIPRIQHDFGDESPARRTERQKRLARVKDSFVHSWKGYRGHAWLQDEVTPISKGYKNEFGGWGATLVDTLDTLYIMGMEKEFTVAVAALNRIDFSSTELDTLNVFETTIRYLGGLLSAYDLSKGKHPTLFGKAVELGDMLYKAFDTPNRMPMARWDWKKYVRTYTLVPKRRLPKFSGLNEAQEAPAQILSAELGSLSLEFTRLSQLTGDSKYYDAVQRITDQLERQQNNTWLPGLWPVMLDAKSMDFTTGRAFTFGGMADSLYEYLPKACLPSKFLGSQPHKLTRIQQYLMLGNLPSQYRNMYALAIDTAKKHLFFRPLNPDNRELLLSGTVMKNAAGNIKLDPQGQHLACFTGGMVALAAKIFDRPDDIDIARKLVEGCIWAYESMPSSVMPETSHVVPCEEGSDCTWSKEAWYNAIAHKMNYVEGSIGRIEEFIRTSRLPPGFTQIADPRYLLRYVHMLSCLHTRVAAG